MSAETIFTTMEKKEKPKVPAKPRRLSQPEKAKNFDIVVTEITEVIECEPIKFSTSESINKQAHIIRDDVVKSAISNVDIIEASQADEASIYIENFLK